MKETRYKYSHFSPWNNYKNRRKWKVQSLLLSRSLLLSLFLFLFLFHPPLLPSLLIGRADLLPHSHPCSPLFTLSSPHLESSSSNFSFIFSFHHCFIFSLHPYTLFTLLLFFSLLLCLFPSLSFLLSLLACLYSHPVFFLPVTLSL